MVSVIIFSSPSCNRAIKRLSIKHSNIECCVLGNGPSLNNILTNDIDSIKGKDLIVLNYFCNTEYFKTLKPKYYIIIDPNFFTKHSDDNSQHNLKRFIEELRSVTWKMVLFLPYQNKDSQLVRTVNNSNINWTFINITPVKGLKKINYYLYSQSLGMPFAQSVIIVAIFMGIKLKYKKIHLYGVDQSWLKGMYVDENNVVRAVLNHFYPYKFDVQPPSLSNLLRTQYNLFYSHEQLQEYATYKKIEILNHVKDSYIDAYKKVL